MWVFKTYKTRYRENDTELVDSLNTSPLAINAVKRRLNGLAIPIDLTRHKDRQMFGYNYLEYLK